jgi:hypothetical protein
MSRPIDEKLGLRSEVPLKEGTEGVGIKHKGCKLQIFFVSLGFAET